MYYMKVHAAPLNHRKRVSSFCRLLFYRHLVDTHRHIHLPHTHAHAHAYLCATKLTLRTQPSSRSSTESPFVHEQRFMFFVRHTMPPFILHHTLGHTHTHIVVCQCVSIIPLSLFTHFIFVSSPSSFH